MVYDSCVLLVVLQPQMTSPTLNGSTLTPCSSPSSRTVPPKVEKSPTVVRDGLPKELADDMKAKLEAVGAKVKIS